jgi:nitrite reductase/ring-hydroxylating ferredoxin subunit
MSNTPEFHRILLGPAADIPVNTGKEYVHENRIIAVFHVEEGFYALDGMCPHAGGPLAKGHIRQDVVTCPWHGWQFNVKTGHHCLNDRIKATTYQVEVDQEQIYLLLQD